MSTQVLFYCFILNRSLIYIASNHYINVQQHVTQLVVLSSRTTYGRLDTRSTANYLIFLSFPSLPPIISFSKVREPDNVFTISIIALPASEYMRNNKVGKNYMVRLAESCYLSSHVDIAHALLSQCTFKLRYPQFIIGSSLQLAGRRESQVARLTFYFIILFVRHQRLLIVAAYSPRLIPTFPT